jgi:hypothetical protein
MDITFHYPPELFELIIETIPLLCRSKKAVLLFLQGSGVSTDLLKDLRQKVEQDKDSINKYEIVRTTLTRLNEHGERSLRERREILKRITEFEDFSTCWPNDQLKAKGLVAEIRRVINVKDSFTRMKQEAERARQQRQAEYQAEIKARQDRHDGLLSIKSDLYSLFSMPSNQSQRRGKLLEGVLNRLFKINEILVRQAFELSGQDGEGIIEQIDGVVEIDGQIYLVEMKWWKEPLGKGDVSPHLVNVFNRGHAGGILISNSGYTQPAIATCKDALTQKVLVMCELEEIVKLLEQQSDLAAFLKGKIQAAIIDKNPFYKPLD